MSDRLIRDEILTSERYWSVSNDAKLFFIHIMLNADDTARFSGKNFTLRSSCFPGQPIDEKHIERMLEELHDHDLIRIYTVKNERFIFVPRFKQRLRFRNSKFPEPPNEINDLVIEKSDSSQSQDRPKTDSSQPKRREVKRREVKNNTSAKPDGLPASASFEKFWSAYPKSKRKSGRSKCLSVWQKKGLDAKIDEILQHLKAVSYDYSKDGGQYCPAPLAYLNQEKWDGFDASDASDPFNPVSIGLRSDGLFQEVV